MKSNKIHYTGSNSTRNSVCKNPGAWTGANTHIFGVREFRNYGYASDATKDAVAEKEMSGGWSKKKNVKCEKCYVMKSINGSCMCE